MDSFTAMDMSAIDAASRQKSCNACVRGKRKCDKRLPRCTRCTAKGLDCLYKKVPADSASRPDDMDVLVGGGGGGGSMFAGATGTQTPSTETTISLGMDDGGVTAEMPDFDMGFDIESLDADGSPESYSTGQHQHRHQQQHHQHLYQQQHDVNGGLVMDPALDFNIVDLLNNSHDSWNLSMSALAAPSKMTIPPVPSAPAPTCRVRDMTIYQNAARDCPATMDPVAVADPRSRPGFITNWLTNMHKEFAQTRALPFIHPRLYTSPEGSHSARMPKTILAAFAVSATYANRTPETRGWVLRLLHEAADEISSEGSREGLSMHERLGRVQAWLVLAGIRVFDGDLTARAAVDREMGRFVEWVHDLKALRDELEAGLDMRTLMDKSRPPKTWDQWVFLESVRRTIIVALSFRCLYHVLKAEPVDWTIFQNKMHFTVSSHLWNAQTSLEFFNAWREKPQYLVEQMMFTDVWARASPADLDEFGKLMLTTQIGADMFDHFMAGDSSIFVNA